MTLKELKENIALYQYFEDSTLIDAVIASIIATRLEYGNNIWFIIIGPSSGGKSQILKPLAMTDPKFIHKIDDLTPNTLLSGANLGQGKGDPSLLKRIGERGILVFSDLTMLMSKSGEALTDILGQFRGLYDGEMNKMTGTSDVAISWKGSIGVLAGSTPEIYRSFEEQRAMGERFVYWRMKDYDARKAAQLAVRRSIYGHNLDDKLTEFYTDYIRSVLATVVDMPIVLDEATENCIIEVSVLAELVRTTAHTNFYGVMDQLPVPAMPSRVALQLTAIAKGLLAMRKADGGHATVLGPEDRGILEWCGWSLADDKKRKTLRTICSQPFGTGVRTQTVADAVTLSTDIVGVALQNLAAVGILSRTGDASGLVWSMKDEEHWRIVRRVEGLEGATLFDERALSVEEAEEQARVADIAFDKI